MKRIAYTSIILVFLLVMSTGAGAAVEKTTTAAAATAATLEYDDKSLSVEKAQVIALDNSRQAVVDDLDIKAKKSALTKLKKDADELKDAYGYENLLNNRIIKEVDVIQAENAIEIAKMIKRDNSTQLRLQVSETFQNILLAQKELEMEEEKLAISKELFDFAKSRFAANSITSDELDTAEYNYLSKSFDLEAVQDKCDVLYMNLKILLNLPLESELPELEGTIELLDFKKLDINKVAVENEEQDKDIFTKLCDYNAAKKKMELTAEYFITGIEQYDSNKAALEAALRDYESVRRNREVKIKNSYNNILNKKDSVELSGKYKELQSKKLDNVKIRYDKGYVNKEAYLREKQNYLDAIYNEDVLICDMNLQINEFLSIINAE